MKNILILSAVLTAFHLYGTNFQERRGIRYSGESERCALDVKWPAGVNGFATVVNFHGGGLVGGSRHYAPWPRRGEDCEAVAFVSAGYRLMSAGGTVTPENCIDDAAKAVSWVLDHIAEFGGDPHKVFVTGISGGGYLTAMVGMDAKWLAKYAHSPSELAGIIPLTGQMTKHFNVRKIGFRDNDPQFQPKIDEWAPLYYASAKGLPPACFCTGGRDVEWKCRVEENELLAASMRNCGYPLTEFHETEGDHGGGVKPSSRFLRDFVMKTCNANGVSRFSNNERVVFYGDSITHGGRFIYYLQLFQDLRYPGSNVRLINGGRSGGTAGDGLSRFDRDLVPMKVDRAFVMFGMNDVGRDYWKSDAPDSKTLDCRRVSVKRFSDNTAKLCDRLASAGVKTVLMTPSPFDQYGEFAKENIPHCNDGLALCAEEVRRIAAVRSLGVADLHLQMTDIFKRHAKDWHCCADRVHPNAEGHLVMAALILDAMCETPTVAHTVINVAGKGFTRAHSANVVVSGVVKNSEAVSFTYAPKALPFPKLPEYVKADDFVYPLTRKLNQEVMEISGLAAGTYTLEFDGVKVGEFTADQFKKGVNIAQLDTPNQRRAQAAAAVIPRLYEVVNAYRRVVLVKYMIQDDKIDASDRAATDVYLDKWLAARKSSPWYLGVKAWIDGYKADRDREVEMCSEINELYERMAVVRPAVSRVRIFRRK